MGKLDKQRKSSQERISLTLSAANFEELESRLITMYASKAGIKTDEIPSNIKRELKTQIQKFRIALAVGSQAHLLLKNEDEEWAIEVEGRIIPPQLGERILLLILSKEERINIPGDLAEEYAEIAEKHGKRFAKVWYYKQVGTSAWPLIWKCLKWGVWTSIGAWIRRII